jgi:hypothetical protein
MGEIRMIVRVWAAGCGISTPASTKITSPCPRPRSEALMGKPVSVEIYTTTHRILGRIDLGASGLFSHLIPTTRYLEVDGAHINRLHQPGKMVARYQTLWVVKNEIVTVLLSSRAEVGPAGWRGGYSTMVPALDPPGDGGGAAGQVETPGNSTTAAS